MDILTAREQLTAGLRDIDTARRIQELVRKTRQFIEKKQEEILATKNDALVGWYELLNPDERIPFRGIDVASDSLLLKAESYGEAIGAAASLSEAHLNCLGISVFLMQGVDNTLPYRFIVIDDPIQSMDQSHKARFEGDVLARVLEEGYQVILLSHLDSFLKDIEQLHRQRCPQCLEFEKYERTGPVIRENVPLLKEYLANAKERQNASGKKYRRECCLYLRMLVERFCKELYIAKTGNTIPRRYKGANFKELRELLKQTACDPADEDRLKNTFSFATSFHHDDENAEPPTEGELQKHVSRMESLVAKYDLIKK